ncbi:hypothetical protein [Aquimarina brevivitae]|uniref:Uncharacterized protein n=1 Tax=Aquimarina brevivitae TaxID=323412 RepID=A0A4Q7NZZ5_9FLAO|nr:hypothetical protein [Aquimarina brevivitae]RZS91942.1 hypothetical protein EV197_3046 [Aquimarina brevivitae]
MKKLILLGVLGVLVSCNSEPKKKKYDTEETKEIRNPEIIDRKEDMVSTPEAIANAHGYADWKDVIEVAFTFNVDRDSTHFERSWKWYPKKNSVTAITVDSTETTSTYTYNRNDMDSTAIAKDRGFINDKYWLFAPLQLVWDQNNYKAEVSVSETAPISQKKMQKLTIVYDNDGGYTPGDAYDFYFEGDFKIKEWVYRAKNQDKPSMITTFEDYKSYNGLKLPTMHTVKDADTKLYFTDVEISKE